MKKISAKSIGVLINITAWLFPSWSTDFSFNLLCKVKRVGISDAGKAFFSKGKTIYITSDNYIAALHKWGTGKKKILFVHGWLSNSQRWRPYVDQLDLNLYTVYALDAPGHGMAKGNKLHVEAYRGCIELALTEIGRVDTMVCHSLGSLATAYASLSNIKLPVGRFVIMGAPSGMDAIFVYFKEVLNLSERAIDNLEKKIKTILQVPHREITMARFFEEVQQPVLVIHDKGDRVTPFLAIKTAIPVNSTIKTYFVEGLDHNLKGENIIKKSNRFCK